MRGPSTPSMTSLGMPMSAITMLPACASAGGNTSGNFGAASVTVRPAWIDGPMASAESADKPDGILIDTAGMPEAFTSATTDSINPESGVLSPVPKIASTISVQSLTSEKCSSHAWLSAISTTVMPRRPRISRFVRAAPRTSPTRASRHTHTRPPRRAVRELPAGDAQTTQELEVRPRVAPDVAHPRQQEHRHVGAALRQRPGDDEAIAAVVAAPAQHRDLAVEKIAVHRPHGRHRLAAGVLHEDERGDADVVDRAPIGLAHLSGVQHAHTI